MTLHTFPANAVRRRKAAPGRTTPAVGDRVRLPDGRIGTILITCIDGRTLVMTRDGTVASRDTPLERADAASTGAAA